jgi:hypothetical protein
MLKFHKTWKMKKRQTRMMLEIVGFTCGCAPGLSTFNTKVA